MALAAAASRNSTGVISLRYLQPELPGCVQLEMHLPNNRAIPLRGARSPALLGLSSTPLCRPGPFMADIRVLFRLRVFLSRDVPLLPLRCRRHAILPQQGKREIPFPPCPSTESRF